MREAGDEILASRGRVRAVAVPVGRSFCPVGGTPLRDRPGVHDLTEAYVAARCAGYSSFKAKETPNEKAGEGWAQNSAGNVQSTGHLLAKALPVASLADVTDEMMTRASTLIERLPAPMVTTPRRRTASRRSPMKPTAWTRTTRP